MKPSALLDQELKSLKARIGSIAGEYIQLRHHEPHLTLYLAEFTGPVNANAITAALPPIPKIDFSLKGWRVFEERGEKVLTCQLEENPQLSRLQLSLVDALAPFKSKKLSPCWDAFEFGDAEKENLAKYGAPYVGSNWIPHLTVASLLPDAFDAVWPEVENDCPTGVHSFVELQATLVRGFEQIGELFSIQVRL
ncbi:MAG: 2'-5' RNA ligase family protein [Candidatus Micrarchaeia archaeon]